MSEQKANAISTEHLSMKELHFLLFGKKVCPNCGTKLIKSKEHIYIKGDDPRVSNGEWVETPNGKVFKVKGEATAIHPSHTVKYIFHVFTCPKCVLQFRLSDLANEEK